MKLKNNVIYLEDADYEELQSRILAEAYEQWSGYDPFPESVNIDPKPLKDEDETMEVEIGIIALLYSGKGQNETYSTPSIPDQINTIHIQWMNVVGWTTLTESGAAEVAIDYSKLNTRTISINDKSAA